MRFSPLFGPKIEPFAHERTRATLDVLYEDNHCLAVSKPAGLLVQGDRTGDPTLLDVATQYLRQRYGKPGRVFLGVVHRLDRPVSGVVLLARTSKAAARLAEQFRLGQIRKEYLALVEAPPPATSGTLEHHLAKDSASNRTRIVAAGTPGSRHARLHYRLRARHRGGTLLEVVPETGRSHQIRVQLAACGAVIVGDVRYGSRHRLGSMLALHASQLEFEHPTRHDRVVVEAALPDSWQALLRGD
jgi:23S rRNA pseudouridine1911/1915/1917 synthase